MTTLAVVAIGSTVAAAPGWAFTGYPSAPNATFGAAGSSDGQFSDPLGVAVDDASGDVYVVDQGNDRVEKFDSEGTYLSQLSGGETPAGSLVAPYSVAVDNGSDAAKGDVYVTDVGHAVIDVFNSSGKYLSQIVGTPSPFASALYGVAVDASGNVWAYEENGNVDELNDSGGLLQTFNTGRGAERGFAVDSAGNYYLLFGCGCVGKYDATGVQSAEWGGGGVALAVDRATNDVFLDTGSGIEEFGPFGEPYGTPLQSFGSGGLVSSHGLAVDEKTGTVYASQSEADSVAIFKPGLLPDVSTGATTELEKVGATLEGVVDPDGKEVTACRFEYGIGPSYGQTVACSPAPGSSSGPVTVSAKVVGLQDATTYHYRLVAGNANGVNVGADGNFTTVAAVEGVMTNPATELQATGATLNGSFEPNGFDTHTWFEYGTSEAYGLTTPHEDAGEATEVKSASAPITSLEVNTTYHFRLAAENSLGVAYGSDETLTTKALAPVILQTQSASGVTRVAATVSAKLNPEKSPTVFRILYGETAGYGEHSSELDAGAGLGEETLQVGLLGLVPGTTYHYAVSATNQAGTVTGPDQTFTTAAPTPPDVSTGGASNIALTSATVSGTIDPEGLETSYELDFGTDSSYGTSIYGEAGSGTEGVEIAVPLQELAPATTYHYRLVAISSDGKTFGADETFTTPVYSNPIILPSALPLLQVPAIAFPSETAPTQKVAKKKTTKKKIGKQGKRGKTHHKPSGAKHKKKKR